MAGLSAALVLGRAQRRVIVFDAGEPRNGVAPEAHNYLTQDGTSPLELLRIGRRELSAYPSVQIVDRRADVISEGFLVGPYDEAFSARKILLATGLLDGLPPIEGFRQRWGVSVLHCPFCHGWEVRDKALAIVGNGQSVYDLCVMAKNWSSRVTLCTNGLAELSEDQLFSLEKNGIAIYEDDIVRVEGGGTSVERLIFADGASLECDAVFFRPRRVPYVGLAKATGCATTDAGYVEVDANGLTSVAGVYAAGDMIEPSMQVLPFAAYSGARAAIAIAKSLFEEDFA